MPAPITLRSVIGRVVGATIALFVVSMLAGTVIAPALAGDPETPVHVQNPLAILAVSATIYVGYFFRQLRY